MLDEPGDLQATLQQGGDHLTQAVVPLIADVVPELDIGADVRAPLLPAGGLHLLEVRVLDAQCPRPVGVGQRPEHWVPLAEEQPPAGREEVGHHAGPAPDVGDPAQGPDPGEDEVERAHARGRRRHCARRTPRTPPASHSARQVSGPALIAAGEKSSPVIRAPRRASEIVSVPMWHCRCTPRRPRYFPEPGQVESHDLGEEVRDRSRSRRHGGPGRLRGPAPARPTRRGWSPHGHRGRGRVRGCPSGHSTPMSARWATIEVRRQEELP